MNGFIARLLINALALWIASVLIPGMEITGTGTLFGAALLLGLVNAVLKPLFILFTLPLTILSLGTFLLVINAALLGVVAALLEGFVLRGFLPALGGAVIISVVSWLVSSHGRPRREAKVKVIDYEER